MTTCVSVGTGRDRTERPVGAARSCALIAPTIALAACSLAVASAPATRPASGAAAEAFRMLDRNGDGKITRDELPRPVLFGMMDRNRDGEVTPAEAAAVMGRLMPGATSRPAAAGPAVAMDKHLNLRYATVEGVDPNLLSLDVYAPKAARNCPVMVMIHGGGWRMGDKSNPAVGQSKAAHFVAAGCIYVSVNYRLTPAVQHPVHVQDVAKALAWVDANIARYGGDPKRIIIMGHSADAHLAALVATDERRLKAEGRDLGIVKGVVLLDGAGYDVPRQIAAAGAVLRGMYEAAFTKDLAAQRDASPITHVAAGKGIPPFLILYVASRPDAADQSNRLADALRKAGVRAEAIPCQGKNHMTINQDIGAPGDKPTAAIMDFLRGLTVATRPAN